MDGCVRQCLCARGRSRHRTWVRQSAGLQPRRWVDSGRVDIPGGTRIYPASCLGSAFRTRTLTRRTRNLISRTSTTGSLRPRTCIRRLRRWRCRPEDHGTRINADQPRITGRGFTRITLGITGRGSTRIALGMRSGSTRITTDRVGQRRAGSALSNEDSLPSIHSARSESSWSSAHTSVLDNRDAWNCIHEIQPSPQFVS